MIVIVAALAGAAIGALTARRRKGTAADMAQFAAGYSIAFTIVAVFASFGLKALLD